MRRRIARSRARCQQKAPAADNRRSPEPKPRAGQEPAHRTQPAVTLWRAAESQVV
jgi:hypothetical protein